MGTGIYASLDRLRQSWEKEEGLRKKISSEAAGSYTALTETGKRRKAAAMDVFMS